ncbi:PREDICTED: gustatory receptor for sugar taste 61a [Drosophila arizonae]|uniref:Gustatory receptor n=1 Tax=Drosophila arizonae TaxID=7263 RepID=A0ABM1P0R6_DROAR|nr:PREDICTED: gustatory receptor for sugar taste 61a [Drosophila arizonae]
MRHSVLKHPFEWDRNVLRLLKAKRRQQRAAIEKKWRCAGNAADLEQLDTFHRAIRPYLCLAQVFGMMPLANVLSRSPHLVQFQLRSYATCLSGVFLLLGGVKTMRLATKLIQGGLNAKSMVSVVFFTSGMVICVSFISLARGWSRLIVPWTGIDIIMLFPPYAKMKHSLRRKLLLAGCSLGCLTLIEHWLYYASSYSNFRIQILRCQPNVTQITFKEYMMKEFADIFELVPYNSIFIFYAFFLNGTFTFICNFMDTFIILISLGLSQRFQQMATRVLDAVERYVPDAEWNEIRMHHILLCELMDLVEANMSNIVLISCLSNIYFICNKLLTIFTKLHYPINYAYYWYSLLYLLSRTCAVFICASKINEASLLPLRALSMVPSDHWTEEVQRFSHQLGSQYIGLSGLGLFHLTRRSLFGMMTTLVYYEFMLLQLDAKNNKDDLASLCG